MFVGREPCGRCGASGSTALSTYLSMPVSVMMSSTLYASTYLLERNMFLYTVVAPNKKASLWPSRSRPRKNEHVKGCARAQHPPIVGYDAIDES